MKRVLFGLLSLCFACASWAAVNLNSATAEELEAVKGLGPKKAAAIVEFREKNGPFKSLDDLKKLKGFGDKSIAKLAKELSVGEGAGKPARK